jgi:hypothetical protein
MGELVTIHEPKPIDAYRLSTDAASVCRDIVVATASTIQGRKFVSVEGWQAIALAHGCVAGSRDVERIDGGVRAIGEVRRMSDGHLISTAEGFVGEDETTWFGGKDKKGKVHDKRNDYAIRAMAQTRAISRACRSAFAHVVVMMKAGLQTTPAEEVPSEGFGTPPHDPITGEIVDGPPREKVPGIHKIKERLRGLLNDGSGVTDLEAFNALVSKHKDDLQTIKDANHEWWTGDGEDFEGCKAFIKRRREELQPDSLGLQMLLSLVVESKGYSDLQAIIDEHGAALDELDGGERRRFDEAYNVKETELLKPAKQQTPLEAGAFGG